MSLAQPKRHASSQVTDFVVLSSKGEASLKEELRRYPKGEEHEKIRKNRFGRLDFDRPGIMFGSGGERYLRRVLTQHTAQRVCACFNTV